ncbi:MAG: TetR/AcrR family transcriptional regulator [Pseudomonadales bacterium]
MTTQKRKARVTKDQWLAAALEMFTHGGEPFVKIEQLAREVGVAKAGFYWHFKNREDLLKQLLSFWAHEYTEVVTENALLQELPPRERLFMTMQMIHDDNLAGLDMHFHVWAMKDKHVAKKVRAVIDKRFNFVKSIFSDAGFTGDELEMRTRLFVAHESNELLMFKKMNRSQATKFRENRCRLLLRLN